MFYCSTFLISRHVMLECYKNIYACTKNTSYTLTSQTSQHQLQIKFINIILVVERNRMYDFISKSKNDPTGKSGWTKADDTIY